jgi:hypothetical protein
MLHEARRRGYDRSRMVLVVSGPITAEELCKEAESLWAVLPDHGLSERRSPATYGPVPAWEPGEITLPTTFDSSLVITAWSIPAVTAADARTRSHLWIKLIDLLVAAVSFVLFVDDGQMRPIVITTPAQSADTSVSIPPEGGVVRIDLSGSTGQPEQFAIDTDATVDSDHDGNPLDDADNAGSFSLTTGSPFTYYFAPAQAPRIVTVTLSRAGSEPVAQSFTVNFNGTNVPGAMMQSQEIPVQTSIRGLNADFSIQLPESNSPLLPEWDFGDGTRSLLASPTHGYGSSGDYQVTVSIIDMSTGQTVYAGRSSVHVDGAAVPSSSSSQSSEASQSGNGFSFPFKTVIAIIGLIIGAVTVYVVLSKIKRKATGTIEKKLVQMETKLFEEPSKTTANAPVVPLRKEPAPIKEPVKQEVLDREESQQEFSSPRREQVTPVTTAGPVPDWLKKSTTPAPASPPPPKPPSFAKPPQAPISKPPMEPATPPAQPAIKPSMPQAPVMPPKPAPITPPAPNVTETRPQPTPVPTPFTPPAQKPTVPPTATTVPPSPAPVPKPSSFSPPPAPRPNATPPPQPTAPPPLLQLQKKPDAVLMQPEKKEPAPAAPDETIAIIRAESLEEKSSTQDQKGSTA